MPPHCFTRGLSTLHNSKQQKGGEKGRYGSVCAPPGMLQTCTPPWVTITLGSASQPARAHLKCPGEAVSWITVGKARW